MKYMKLLGLISEYRWATNIDSLKNFVLTEGPVQVGTDWFYEMSNPREYGARDFYLEPEGDLEGGHSYLINGYSKRRGAFRMINSWGPEFAASGRAWIHSDILDYLVFGLNGEAASITEVVI
jgi:hypothetical protein